jgi:hypothetical protein
MVLDRFGLASLMIISVSFQVLAQTKTKFEKWRFVTVTEKLKKEAEGTEKVFRGNFTLSFISNN